MNSSTIVRADSARSIKLVEEVGEGHFNTQEPSSTQVVAVSNAIDSHPCAKASHDGQL